MRMFISGSVIAAVLTSTAPVAAGASKTTFGSESTPPSASDSPTGSNTGTPGTALAPSSAPGIGSGTSRAAGAATGALSLTALCLHTRLSAADQAECQRRVGAATTEAQRLDVRRTFEAKAGLRARSTGTSGASGTSGAPQSNGTGNAASTDTGAIDQRDSGTTTHKPPH
ncbi:MAG: hypothetical protein AB7E79_15435 [Rhodospirillaceae bacterium]